MKELSHKDRQDVFKQCNIDYQKRKTTHNVHHIIQKSDIKRGLVDRHFPVNGRSNLVVLPIAVHNELHRIIEDTPAYRNCIESRIWIANYAYNGELDLL
jgi:hypothetical protein